jgi:chemosensory pili system protein ChpA (sensor histidine kinase/response regulator)
MPTVMVVDDAASMRSAIVRVLRHEGYDTVTAGNGREALTALEMHTPDLILLDVLMPELDGLALLEVLHTHPRWKSLPVVMLTAVSDTHVIRRAEQLGAKAYLVKAAFSVGQVLELVKRYVPTVPPSPDRPPK